MWRKCSKVSFYGNLTHRRYRWYNHIAPSERPSICQTICMCCLSAFVIIPSPWNDFAILVNDVVQKEALDDPYPVPGDKFNHFSDPVYLSEICPGLSLRHNWGLVHQTIKLASLVQRVWRRYNERIWYNSATRISFKYFDCEHGEHCRNSLGILYCPLGASHHGFRPF